MSRGRSRRGRKKSVYDENKDANKAEHHHRATLQQLYGKSAAVRGIVPGANVKLFIFINSTAREVGLGSLPDNSGSDTLQRKLHNHQLPNTQQHDYVSVRNIHIHSDAAKFPYPYDFKGAEGPPGTLGDIYPTGFYAWDTRMMRAAAENRDTDGRDGLDFPHDDHDANTRDSQVDKSLNETITVNKTTAGARRGKKDRKSPKQQHQQGHSQKNGKELENSTSAISSSSTIQDPLDRQKNCDRSPKPVTQTTLDVTDTIGSTAAAVAPGAIAEKQTSPGQDGGITTPVDNSNTDSSAGAMLASADDARGTSISTEQFSRTNYDIGTCHLMLDQLAIPEITLRDVSEQHVCALFQNMLENGLSYAAGLITVCILRSNQNEDNNKRRRKVDGGNGKHNTNGAAGDAEERTPPAQLQSLSVVKHCSGRSRTLDHSITATTIDGVHRLLALRRVKVEQHRLAQDNSPGANRLRWVHLPLRVQYMQRIDGKELKLEELMKLGAMMNDTTSIVRKDTDILSVLHSVMSLMRCCGEDRSVPATDLRVIDVSRIMRASQFMRFECLSTCSKWARLGKVMLTHPEVWEKLKRLNSVPKGARLGISHLSSPYLSALDGQALSLLLDSLFAFINPPPTASPRRRSHHSIDDFYINFALLFESCIRTLFWQYGKSLQLSMTDFLGVSIPGPRNRTRTIREEFIHNVIQFVSTDTEKARLKEEGMRRARCNRLQVRIANHFKPPPPPPQQPMQNEQDIIEKKKRHHMLHERKEKLDKKRKRGSIVPPPMTTRKGSAPANQQAGMSVDEQDHQQQQSNKKKKKNGQDDAVSTDKHDAQKTQPGLPLPPAPSAPPPPPPPSINDPSVARARKSPSEKGLHSRRNRRPPSPGGPTLDSKGYIVPEETEDGGSYDDSVNPLPLSGVRPMVSGNRTSNGQSAKSLPAYSASEIALCRRLASMTPDTLRSLILQDETHIREVDMVQVLRGIYIPPSHRAHEFVSIVDIFAMNLCAWRMAANQLQRTRAHMLGCMDISGQHSDALVNGYMSGTGMPYFQMCRDQVRLRGYTVMHGFADMQSLSRSDIRAIESNTEIGDMFKIPVQQLFNFFLGTWNSRGAHLGPVRTESLWAPIMNTENEEDVKAEKEGAARFSSTRYLVMDWVEKNVANTKIVRRRALLDTWIALLVRMLGLEEEELAGCADNGARTLYIPATGGRLLITGANCPRQIPHNDFPVPHISERKEKLPGYFTLVSGADPFALWICPFSHNFVFETADAILTMSTALQMRKIIIPPHSVLVAHGFLQHAGGGAVDRLTEHTSTRYHLYFAPDSQPLPGSLFFAMGKQLQFDERVPLCSDEPSPVPPSSCPAAEVAEFNCPPYISASQLSVPYNNTSGGHKI